MAAGCGYSLPLTEAEGLSVLLASSGGRCRLVEEPLLASAGLDPQSDAPATGGTDVTVRFPHRHWCHHTVTRTVSCQVQNEQRRWCSACTRAAGGLEPCLAAS